MIRKAQAQIFLEADTTAKTLHLVIEANAADGLGDVDAGAAGGEKEPGEGGGEPDRLRARSARGGVRFFRRAGGR